MDKIRLKAQSLLEKLHDKYGIQPKNHIHVVVATMGKKEGEGTELQDHWYLVDTHGQKFRLPKTMLFLGREECDVVVQSQSVDKRHAVLTFDLYLNRFKLKDLTTANGTFVNNSRIPEEEYVTLHHMDSIRLGHDAMLYHIEQGSQISSHGGQLPDPYFIPPWASRAQNSATIHVHSHAIADCQGCISEQNMEHTCSHIHHKTSVGDQHDSESLCQQYDKQKKQLKGHQQLSAAAHISPPQYQSDKSGHQQNQQFEEHLLYQSKDESKKHGLTECHVDIANICKMGKYPDMLPLSKPVNQQAGHLACKGSVPNTSIPDHQDHMTTEASLEGNAQTMFFVALDDSSGSTNNNAPHCEKEKQFHRNRNHLSSDDSKDPSPANFGLNKGNASDLPVSAATVVFRDKSMESEEVKPHLNATYMEIPLRDDNPHEEAEKIKNYLTTTKCVNSSLPKDSLPVSLNLTQPSKTVKTQSPSAEVNSAMSFTIDLDDAEHQAKKPLSIGSSISAFVPSKLRKTFLDRKIFSAKTSSAESPPTKNFEEREISPLSQQKIDEIYSTVVVEGKGLSRHPNMLATSGSLRSPNLGDIKHLPELSEEWRSQEKDGTKKGSLKKPMLSKSPQLSQSSRTASSSNTESGSESPSSATYSLPMSKYRDPASYLIDKMFDGGIPVSPKTDKELSCEREAGGHDDDCTSQRPSEKSIVRPVIDSMVSQAAAARTSIISTLGKSSKEHGAHGSDDDLRIIEDTPGVDDDVDENDEREDKTSEAGTYTIESDVKEEHEVEEARKRISLVFGVENFRTELPLFDSLYLTETGYYNDGHEDGENTLLDEDDHILSDDDDDVANIIMDEEDYEEESIGVSAVDGVQTWVSQLTSLTSQKSAALKNTAEEDGEVSLSKKPPQGLNRKRPGTGRKLPSIPSDKSPVTNDYGLPVSTNFQNEENVTSGRTANLSTSKNSSTKPRVGSSQPHSSTLKNGCPGSPSSLALSHNSLDTNVLHQEYETAVGAIQPQLSNRSSQSKKISPILNVDTSGTAALIAKEGDYVQPALYKNPRDYLAKKQKDIPTKPGSATSSPLMGMGKKNVEKPNSHATLKPKAVTTPRSTPLVSGTKTSSVSDSSRKGSVDNDSIISDQSSDTGEGNLSRSSSKGKGNITMTRTNKTFDLRRARAGSLDGPNTQRPAKLSSLSKSGTGSSGARPHSLYNTKNSSIPDKNQSETTGIKVQTAKKSQFQGKAKKTGNPVLNLTDSYKFSQSQRLQRASSLTLTQPLPGSRREPTLKSYLRSTPTGRSNLGYTGLSGLSSRSQSQPGSRSNSPKSAEKLAWKRRKEYDPRKSVADAKANKTKDSATSSNIIRAKPITNSNLVRMIRSASFTNSVSLSFSLPSSQTSCHDFTDRKESPHQHDDFCKTFIPFHSSHHNGRSTHSADEEDSLASGNSTQDNARSMVMLLETPSAFTPPLLRNKPISPSEASLSLRRRILNINGESSPSLGKALQAESGDERHLPAHSPQASYDSLIVASVYQLSQKLKTSTDKTLVKLREQNRMSNTPSPVDDYLNDSGKSEITAWKSANQELASTLKNLRTLERHVQMMSTVLFPDEDGNSNTSSDVPANEQVKQKLLEDIEKKFGFQPIDQPALPDETEIASPEMVEFREHFS